MGFFQRLLNLPEKEEEIEMPDHIRVIFTQEAIEKGTLDDFNKEILVIRNRVVVDKIFYSHQELSALLKNTNLPYYDATREEEDEFQFTESLALSGQFKEVRDG